MSMFKRADWLAIAKDRTAIVLLAFIVVAFFAMIALTVLRVHPSDIQVPVRYSGYGQTFIYRDQWYVHLTYIVFGIILVAVNGLLAVKLYQLRRLLGIGMLCVTLIISVVALIVANSIFNLAPSL